MNSSNTERPHAFISYSWTNKDFVDRVISLAKRLKRDGINVTIDQWALKPGQDKNVFMESMVTNDAISHVLILCDKRYADRADGREGGVGTESQIISEQVYNKVSQTKFVPIFMEKDESGKPCLPLYLRSRIGYDLSDDNADHYDSLLRFLWNKPLYEEPPLGEMPAYLSVKAKDPDRLISELAQLERSRDPIRQLGDMLPRLNERTKAIYISHGNESDLVGKIRAAVDLERDLRPIYCEVIRRIISESNNPETSSSLLSSVFEIIAESCFFNGAGYLYANGGDVCKYLGRNVLIQTIGQLLANSRYDHIRTILNSEFVVVDGGRNELSDYRLFAGPVNFIDGNLNEADKQRKVSYSTDLFVTRPTTEHALPLERIADADLLLYCHSALNSRDDGRFWMPYSILYLQRYNSPTKFFVKATSFKSASPLTTILGVSSAEEFRTRICKEKSSRAFFGQHGMHVDILRLLNIQAC